MNILLTHGYFMSQDERERKIMKPYAPLGILYISAWLEKNGFPNEVFDTTFSEQNDLREQLLNRKPDILGIYTNLITKINVLKILDFVKTQETLKHTRVVIGGPDTTYNVQNYLDAGADLLVLGEGEETMLEIVKNYQMSSPDWANVRGIAYRNDDRLIKVNPTREKIKDLDILPFPAREKINIQKYLDTWYQYHTQGALSISTQRGCPYTCRWCSTAVYGQSYRRRSPQSVVDELEYVRSVYKPDLIWFVDDVFTVSHQWIRGFHQEAVQRKVILPFECITRAERLNEEVLSQLKECGCQRIWIGAESGSQEILDAMDRRVNIQQVSAMIRAARHHQIETGTFIMLGYPGETEKDIRATLRYLKLAQPDLVTFTVAYPIKGTSLYEQLKASISKVDWINQTDRDTDFPRTYPRKYYDFALRWLHYSYRYFQNRKTRLTLKNFFARIHAVLIILLCRLGMQWYRRPSQVA